MSKDPWLLIFDNADDPSALDPSGDPVSACPTPASC